MTAKRKILWVDDDHYELFGFVERLEVEGFEVSTAGTVKEAKNAIEKSPPDLVIIDVMMPTGEDNILYEAKGGFASGVVLAKWIKQTHPDIPFVGCSVLSDHHVVNFFNEYGVGFITKPVTSGYFIEKVKRVFDRSRALNIKSFIVHGHDDKTKLELKNYLQNILKIREPIILHEQPSIGRTIIEKFEDYAGGVDIVFVLLTPDDSLATPNESNEDKRRARQNVIFEMGYFLGKLGRRSARVILLHKGPIELPSDINGIVYIDISNGIHSAGEDIRREVSVWL